MKRLDPFILAGLLSFSLALGVIAQPLVRLYGNDGTNPSGATNPFVTSQAGLALAQGTAKNVTVTTASQTVSLNGYSQVITIVNTHATNTLYFNPFGGSASTSNFPIPPGAAFTWQVATPGLPNAGLNQFTLYASGASTVVGVLAH